MTERARWRRLTAVVAVAVVAAAPTSAFASSPGPRTPLRHLHTAKRLPPATPPQPCLVLPTAKARAVLRRSGGDAVAPADSLLTTQVKGHVDVRRATTTAAVAVGAVLARGPPRSGC